MLAGIVTTEHLSNISRSRLLFWPRLCGGGNGLGEITSVEQIDKWEDKG